MRNLFVLTLTAGAIFLADPASANSDPCYCIESDAVKIYCEKENLGLVKDSFRINQEAITRRDIQRIINHSVNAGFAKDAAAATAHETDDFTMKDLSGAIFDPKRSAEEGAHVNNYQGILRISENTWIRVECLTLKGNEAVVYTNQHFVRYVPDRKDQSPHELITNILHREIWIFTKKGWKLRHIEELERGKTYLDGALYDSK